MSLFVWFFKLKMTSFVYSYDLISLSKLKASLARVLVHKRSTNVLSINVNQTPHCLFVLLSVTFVSFADFPVL